jgi:hypothetical protein
MENDQTVRDIRALRRSIKKWSLISVGLGEDLGSDNCELCYEYGGMCVSMGRVCPVWEKADISGCRDTPWMDWNEHLEFDHHVYVNANGDCVVQCGLCRTLANRELMFLQGILEEYKEKLICRD